MTIRRANLKSLSICAPLAAAAIAFAGCGGGDEGSDAGVAQIAPADASLYADATLRPEGEQKAAVESFLSAVLDTSDPGQKLTELIDKGFTSEGEQRTFADDVDPWLGDKGGVFTVGYENDPPAVAAVEATDPDKGVELLDSESPGATSEEYNGVSYKIDKDGQAYGQIDGFVALGDEQAYKAAIDASKGDSLADSERFTEDTADIPDDAIGSAYLDLAGLIKQTAAKQGAPADIVGDAVDKLGINDSLVLSAEAGDKTIGVDLGGLGGSTDDAPSKLLAGLPSDAWFAFGVDDIGGKIDGLLKQIGDAGIPGVTPDVIAAGVESQTGLNLKEDLTSWLGGAAIFVRGTDPANLDGALVLESTDDAKAAQALNSIRETISAQGQGTPQPLELGSGGNGFTLTDPTVAPQAINFVQQNGKVVIGVGDVATQQALNPTETLAQAPAFTSASGSIGGGGPQFFVSLPDAVKVLAQDPQNKADAGFAQALPYLQRLAFLTAGGGGTGLKIVVGAK